MNERQPNSQPATTYRGEKHIKLFDPACVYSICNNGGYQQTKEYW